MNILHKLLANNDYLSAAVFFTKRFGVFVNAKMISDWLQPAATCDSHLLTSFKCHLIKLGLFKPAGVSPMRINIPVPLHIGFIGVEETEEQLELLRYSAPSERAPMEVKFARTKFFATETKPTPVNSVASRVARPLQEAVSV